MTSPTPNAWRLYRIYSHTGALLYIGITGRKAPIKRLGEHMAKKPWAAEIARWEIDPRVWATEAEVLAVEKAAIKSERPRYNVTHNRGPRPAPALVPAVASPPEPIQPRARVEPPPASFYADLMDRIATFAVVPGSILVVAAVLLSVGELLVVAIPIIFVSLTLTAMSLYVRGMGEKRVSPLIADTGRTGTP